MEGFADGDAAIEEFFAGGIDAGNDEIEALDGAGCGAGNVAAKDDGSGGAGRSELDDAEVSMVVVIGIETPAEFGVEVFSAIDVGDRDDDDLELHVGGRRGDVGGGLGRRHRRGAHDSSSVVWGGIAGFTAGRD